jgi:hypothetical protein
MNRVLRVATATVFGAVVAVTVPVTSLPTSVAPLTVTATSAEDNFHWSGRLAAGQTIEIKGINGSITAEPSASGEVEVFADKVGRGSDPAGVRIDVVPHAGGVTICAVYPNPTGPPNECAPGTGGRMNARDNDVKVDFRVSVPAGVSFEARTVNGGITASGLQSRVGARTVNGSITIGTSGLARAETVNGSVNASLGDATWDGQLEFRTVNGALDVRLPSSASAHVVAETVNGDLQSDFPVTMQGKFGPKRFEGTVGQGGRDLVLKTVNGRIALHRAP